MWISSNFKKKAEMLVMLQGGWLLGSLSHTAGCPWQQVPGSTAKGLDVFSDNSVNSQHGV